MKLPVGSMDLRTREARLLKQVRADLTRHVGGAPNAVQRRLIERAAMLTLHITRMDAAAIAADAMSPHATREYLAWTNTLARTLKLLGLKAEAEKPSSLADYLASRAA